MPSKPRTLAGILCPRRQTDRAYNRLQRDPVTAAIHGSARWQAVRAQVLRAEPVCRACAARGLTEPATVVDHIVGVALAPDRAYDPTNLQPLCTSCNAWKSASERRRSGVDPGVGGGSSSRGEGPPSGAWGTSRFSRVSGNPRNGPEGPDLRASLRTQGPPGEG